MFIRMVIRCLAVPWSKTKTPHMKAANPSKMFTERRREILQPIRKIFFRTFRTDRFDGWGISYNKQKMGSTPFETKFFRPYVRTGMTMYESACGIGLNLLTTSEILEAIGIMVYGNEYVKESVERSEVVLGEGVIPAGNRRGVICTGDWTNLSHVPSNTFDLVYTGYITLLLDSLSIDLVDDLLKYTGICVTLQNRTENDWMGQKLWDIVMKRQHDW